MQLPCFSLVLQSPFLMIHNVLDSKFGGNLSDFGPLRVIFFSLVVLTPFLPLTFTEMHNSHWNNVNITLDSILEEGQLV